jgi:hypothetical protein
LIYILSVSGFNALFLFGRAQNRVNLVIPITVTAVVFRQKSKTLFPLRKMTGKSIFTATAGGKLEEIESLPH